MYGSLRLSLAKGVILAAPAIGLRSRGKGQEDRPRGRRWTKLGGLCLAWTRQALLRGYRQVHESDLKAQKCSTGETVGIKIYNFSDIGWSVRGATKRAIDLPRWPIW